MLEERLSKAYSQHNLGGYSLPAPRQSSVPYPSIGANVPSTLGSAENYYTGETQVDYSRPLHGQPAQHYPPYDQRGSAGGFPHGQYAPQQPQRTDSWGANAPPTQQPPYTQQPSYPPPDPSQYQQENNPQQPPQPAPSVPDSVGATPTADPTASFYFNQQQAPSQAPQPQTQTQTPVGESPYPNLQQSIQPQQQTYQPSPAQTPGSAPAQPAQGQPRMSSQPSQPYWQHSAAQQTQLPPVWEAQPQVQAAYGGYTQETFPAAPQHAPKQPVVEEALIEL